MSVHNDSPTSDVLRATKPRLEIKSEVNAEPPMELDVSDNSQGEHSSGSSDVLDSDEESSMVSSYYTSDASSSLLEVNLTILDKPVDDSEGFWPPDNNTSRDNDFSGCPPDSTEPKRGKKRSRYNENWAKVKTKLLKNSGQSYVSKSGKIIEAKQIKPPCTDKCKFLCSKKFPEAFRQELFKYYWGLGSLQKQRDFLMSCIEPLDAKFRRISSDDPRRPNCEFFIPFEGNKIRVCKKYIVNTFAIGEGTLRPLVRCRSIGLNVPVEEKRGKHGNQKKTDEEILESVRKHINSIPRIESNYVVRDPTKEYVDGELTIAKMHRLYLQDTSGKNTANYETYSRVFSSEFNIGFFNPRKEHCNLCELHKNTKEVETMSLEASYHEHMNEIRLSLDEMTADKERARKGEIILAVYNLPAIFTVPTGQPAFFYRSRLDCYNFTVTEIEKDSSYCFFWHEGLGQRGVTEIATSIWLCLKEFSKRKPHANVVFYSDNSGGQQKNRFLYGLYIYAVETLRINSITHKYLVRGHSQNEGDTVHDIVEKSLKKAKKSGPIYVPDQLISLIRTSKKRGNPLRVKELNYGDFYDMKALYNDMGLNLSKNTEGNEFEISCVRVVEFTKGKDCFRYKLSFLDTEWYSVDFRLRNMCAQDSEGIYLKPAYSKKFSLSEKKITDLKTLIESRIVPEFYKDFYDDVCT